MRMMSVFILCLCPTPKNVSLNISPQKRLNVLIFGVYSIDSSLLMAMCIVKWNSSHPFCKRSDEFLKLSKNEGGSDFSHKNRGVGKIGRFLFKKTGHHIFSYWTFLMLSFFHCVVCVSCPFTSLISAFVVFYRKNLVLWNLISRYTTSTKEIFEKQKHCRSL